VALGDDVCGVFGGSGESGWDGDVGADDAHDGVDWRVHTEGLTDDGVEDGEAFEFFVGRGAQCTVRVAELFGLFFEDSVTFSQGKKNQYPGNHGCGQENSRDIRSGSQMEESPRTGGRARVMTSQEERKHDMSDFGVWECTSITIFLVRKGCEHVRFVRQAVAVPPALKNVEVVFGHLLVGYVTFPVTWQGKVGEHEVDRGETCMINATATNSQPLDSVPK
jgi:uncharacterized cupin superfamily protein